LGGYDYDTFADDLATLIDRLDLNEITLIGFSMGGGEVARYIGRHGTKRVSRVVLMSAVPPFLLKTKDHMDGVDLSVFDALRAGVASNRQQFFSDFGDIFYGANRPGASIPSPILDWTFAISMQASLKGSFDCIKAFSETDFRIDLKAFDVPTLIMHGDDDQVVPFAFSGDKSAKEITGARLRVYKGAPHGIWFTLKDRINADLLSFIEGETNAGP
jgi:non-heme chloroperoxidase